MGPGHLMRAVARLFFEQPDGAWTVEDLCERVLGLAPGMVEQRHRVCLRCAASEFIAYTEDWAVGQSQGLGRLLVYFNRASVLSYALARLKSDRQYRYQSRIDGEGPLSEADLLKRLADNEEHHLIIEGGAWRRHVERYIAIRNALRIGNGTQVAKIQEEQQRETDPFARSFMTVSPRSASVRLARSKVKRQSSQRNLVVSDERSPSQRRAG
ncbi:MAG TPA: hypothetical protein VGU20_05375 [Stellaceae bacterium]|nr:hypothetical protein [Stellaceae bacterium]